MNDYYSLEIAFPEINFDNYCIKCENVKYVHHAHLSTKANEIELKIFYEPKTYFGEKISMWTSRINWGKFGSFIKTSNENQNDRLKRIDFSNSKLLGMSNGTGQFEGNSKFVIIKLDSAKFYWNPVKEELNTAEFYFNDAGFNVVSDFYGSLFGLDGEFSISRMDGMDVFYQIEKAEFRPEFNFCYSDNKENSKATIIKEPKLQFRYKENISEDEAVLYGEVIRLIASFYFHTKIDFILTRIHLTEYTLTIKKIQEKNYYETSGGLWGFKNYWDFHKLLQADWQPQTFLNFNVLSKVI